MSAVVQQLQTIQEQCSDCAIVFLVLVFLQHHIASNSKKKVEQNSEIPGQFLCARRKTNVKQYSTTVDLPNFMMCLQDFISKKVYIEKW